MTYKRDDAVLPLIFHNYLGPKNNVVIPFSMPEDLRANDKLVINVPMRKTNGSTDSSCTVTLEVGKADDDDDDLDIGNGNITSFSTAWTDTATATKPSFNAPNGVARFVLSVSPADYITHAAAGGLFAATVSSISDSGAISAYGAHFYLQRKR